jgi:hypothetical protein
MPYPRPFRSARGDCTVTDSREGRLSQQELVAFQDLVLGSTYRSEYMHQEPGVVK